MSELIANPKWGRSLWWVVCLLMMLPACAQAPTPTITPSSPTHTPHPSNTPQIGVAFVTIAPPTLPVFQTIPTPLPTPTVTPTPTPIIYAIQSGDTIWTIAAKSGRNVDEILGMNPGINPAQLQIGQQVALPPAPTPIFSDGVHTRTPPQIQVQSVATYRTATGGVWLMGEVENVGGLPALNLQLSVDLLDSMGESVGGFTAWVEPTLLPAGTKAPFAVLFPQLPVDFVQPRVSVIGGETVAGNSTYIVDLQLVDSNSTIDDNRVQIEGFVANHGEELAIEAIVVATCYATDGRVVGYATTSVEMIPAGEKSPFFMQIVPPGGQIATVQMVVQGRK